MVKVKVYAPQRCKGDHEFTSLEKFYQWVNENFKRPKGLGAEILLSLAEQGIYNAYTGLYSIACFYDKPLGYQAKEIAREIGFLKTRWGSDIGFDLKRALEYIRRLS